MTTSINRNSFVLYNDNHDIFCSLTKDQKADLIDAIFEYQKNGELPTDPIIKVAISSFISQFKRDSQKWEKTCEEKTIAGKMGNLKRWHPELHKKVINGEITLDKAMRGLQPEELSQPDRTQSDPIGKIANIAVSDNVNVSVSVNDIINTDLIKLKSDFGQIYRLYNQGKKLKVIPFDKFRIRFQNCLKEISFEELKQNIEDYLKYLSRASWRQKKSFEAWINSSEFFANDWNSEGASSGNDNLALSSLIIKLNSIAGKQLFIKTEISYDDVVLKCESSALAKEAKELSQDIKDEIKKEVLIAHPGKNLRVSY
jgi:hypothetical protein